MSILDKLASLPFLQFLGCTSMLYVGGTHFWCVIGIFEGYAWSCDGKIEKKLSFPEGSVSHGCVVWWGFGWLGRG